MSIKSFFHRLNRKDISLFPRIPRHLPFILFTLFVFASAALIPKIKAADLNKESDLIKIQNSMKLKNNQESWMKSGLESNIVSANIIIGGTLTDIRDIELESYRPGGIIGQAITLTGSLYYLPVSGIQYIASMKDNLLGKPAYAQTGIGFKGLQPLIKLWSAMRNTVYVLVSFFFIILGIMIMLRVKISPQAVMNLQNTIPKIITILILVTFSYAIAGLMIDLSYLLFNIFLWLMFVSQGKNFKTDQLFPNTYTSAANPFITTNAHTFKALNNPGFWDTYYLYMGLVPTAAISMLVGLIGLLMLVSGNLLGLGIALLINIIIALMVCKFFFGLAKTYVTVLFKVVLGPVEIAMGAFPGSKMNFSSWLTSLFANIMVFPVSIGFIILIFMFQNVAKSNLWSPPGLNMLGNSTINLLIGFVAITILPAFPTLVPQTITNSKPSPWGQALNQQMATIPIVAPTWKAAKSGLDFSSQRGIAASVDNKVRGIKNWIDPRLEQRGFYLGSMGKKPPRNKGNMTPTP